MQLRSLVILALSATACAGLARKDNYYSVNADGSRSQKYSRVNQYTAYGQGGLGAQSTIAAAYEQAQHAPAPAIPIEVFNASLPAGVTIDQGAIQIAKDAPYESVGRYEIGYWLDSAPQESEVEDDLKRLAAVTESNVVVVEVTRVGHGDTRVNYLSGILLRKRGPSAAPGALAKGEPASTDRVRAKARLVYAAKPRGCLTQAELSDEISAKLGYSPWVESDVASTLRLDIVQQAGKFVATVVLADGARKELSGATCKTVTDAAISVVVVQLDRVAAPPKRYD
jgi:hypothetical protein